METKKLSDYMGSMFNAVYLHPKRTAETIDENISSEKGDLFGAVFPLPNHYTYEAGEGGFTVTQHEDRKGALAHKGKNSKAESHRDYLILDVPKFEEWLTSRSENLKRRMPKGMKAATPNAGFLDESVLLSLTTEEARMEYARKIAGKVATKRTRNMSPEQKEAAAERMRQYHAEKKKKGNSKSTKR